MTTLPSTSPVESRPNWLRNSNFSRMSWTLGENPVQVGVEVVAQLLLRYAGGEVFKAEWGGIVEGLASRVLEDRGLVLDACVVGPFLLVQDLLLGGLQHGVQAPEDGHGENHVPVLAPYVRVPEEVVGDSPDEVGNGAELRVLHSSVPYCRMFAGGYIRSPGKNRVLLSGLSNGCLLSFRASSSPRLFISGLGGDHASLAVALRPASLRLRDCLWASAQVLTAGLVL